MTLYQDAEHTTQPGHENFCNGEMVFLSVSVSAYAGRCYETFLVYVSRLYLSFSFTLDYTYYSLVVAVRRINPQGFQFLDLYSFFYLSIPSTLISHAFIKILNIRFPNSWLNIEIVCLTVFLTDNLSLRSYRYTLLAVLE